MISYSNSRAATSRELFNFAKLESLKDPHCQSVLVAMQAVLEKKNEDYRDFKVPTRRDLKKITLYLLVHSDQQNAQKWRSLCNAFIYELPNISMLNDGPMDAEVTSHKAKFILTPADWFGKIMHDFTEATITQELLRELRVSAKEYELSGHSEIGPLREMRFYLSLLRVKARALVGPGKTHQILTQIDKIDLRVQREMPRIGNRDSSLEYARTPSWLRREGD